MCLQVCGSLAKTHRLAGCYPQSRLGTHTRGGREANKVAFGYLFVQINVSYTGFEANFGDFSVFGARF